MIIVIGALLGLHWLLFVIDEMRFHRNRPVSPREKWGFSVDLLLIGLLTAYAILVPYGEFSNAPFGGLLVLALFCVTKNEWLYDHPLSAGERALHSFLSVLHPLAVLMIAGLWPFMRGVNFMVGMMLPFDTREIFPLLLGYGALMILFGLYSLSLFKKRAGNPVQGPVPKGAAPLEEPKAPTTA